jgi:hypothetical protein
MKVKMDKLNSVQAEVIARQLLIKYLYDNNFDNKKILADDPDFGGGSGLTNDSYLFKLYIPRERPIDALIFVEIEIHRITKEYQIIPGTTPELEKYKKG